MATKCIECGEKFTLRDALCEDWKDENKSFGCPHCGTFYVKNMNSSRNEKLTILAVSVAVASFSLATVFFFLVNILQKVRN